VAGTREEGNTYGVLVEKPERKRLLCWYWRRWEDNIKMCLKGLEREVWNGFIWLRIGVGVELL
jgi:hypothetical protein